MFSIIIPVYNAEKHLDKCLQSIISQTYKNIEIIIINDGSTDNSPQIIEKYGSLDSRIKIITQENAGLSAARNSGLKLTSKEYVMFVDSDDYIGKNTCKRLAEYIEKEKSDVYVFGVYYDYGSSISTGGQKLKYERYENGNRYMETALKQGSFRTFAFGKLFRRELLGIENTDGNNKIRFVNGLLYEDMFFIVQVFCAAKTVSVIPEFFYHYVQHKEGRITVKYNEKDLDVLIFISMLNDSYYKTNKISAFIYAVLSFRWVSSCLIYKYIKGYLFSRQARKIINVVMNDKNFIEAVKLCARKENIPERDRYLAKLIGTNRFLYLFAVYFLVLLKSFWIWKNSKKH